MSPENPTGLPGAKGASELGSRRPPATERKAPSVFGSLLLRPSRRFRADVARRTDVRAGQSRAKSGL